MTMIRFLIVAFSLVVTTQAHALILIEKKVIDGRSLEGSFGNGSRFELRQKTDGRTRFTFEHKGKRTFISAPAFDRYPTIWPPDNEVKPGTYSWNSDDFAVFFSRGSSLYMLTDTGLFSEILPNPERFRTPAVYSIRANLYSESGDKYAVISGKYESEVVSSSKYSGETFLVRLRDGAVSLIDRDFHPHIGQIKVLDEKVVFQFAETFDLKNFEQEALAREKKFPFTTTTSQVQHDTDSKSWVFENGNELTKEVSGDVTKVYFTNADGKKELVVEGKIGAFPKAKSTVADQKIVTFEAPKGLVFVTESGAYGIVPANYNKVRGRESFVRSHFFFAHEGIQYALISFVYEDAKKIGEGPGETFLIREDGRFFRMNYVSHDLTSASTDFLIQDGILEIPGSYRNIDLRAFDTEAEFDSKMTSKSPRETLAALNGMLVNLSEQARHETKAYKPEPGSKGEKVLHQMRVALQMPETKSLVVLGDSGVGKTEVVNYFIEAVARGDIPEVPRTWDVYRFDSVSFNSGASLVGVHEARTQLILEAARMAPMFFFIDEIHSLRGSGTHSGKSNDVFQDLKPALSNGELMILGTSTSEEYHQAFSGDAALDRRINEVVMDSPTGKEVESLVRGWILKNKKPMPEAKVFDLIVRLAEEFNAVGNQPTKTIKLLKQIYAEMAVAGKRMQKPELSDVNSAAQKLYQADPAQFDLSKMREKLNNLETLLNSELIGQDLPKKMLVELVRQAYAGTHDTGKPRVRMLNVGPPGSGKTEMALLTGKALGLPVERFEMNNYRSGDEQKFLGQVAQALRKNAFSILLFDEIEKAPEKVQEALLAMLDSGTFTVSENLGTSAQSGTRRVKMSARNAMVLMTSNAGSKLVTERASHGQREPLGFKMEPTRKDTKPVDSEVLHQAVLKDGISSPLLDRTQAVVAFLPASREEFGRVVRLHLHKAIKNQSEKHSIEFVFSVDAAGQRPLTASFINEDMFIEDVLKRYYKVGVSNRRALEIVQNTIRSVLGHALLNGVVSRNSKLSLQFDGEKLVVLNCEQLLL